MKKQIKFSIPEYQQNEWAVYCEIKGYRDISHLATVAIVQFIARNPLTQKQAQEADKRLGNTIALKTV